MRDTERSAEEVQNQARETSLCRTVYGRWLKSAGGERCARGNGLAGRKIQNDVKPPVGLVANLDGHATQRRVGADENCEIDLLARQLVRGNEVELHEIRVRRVEERCFVSSVQLDRKRSHVRGAFEGQGVFLRIMNVAALPGSLQANKGEVHQLGNRGEE